MYTWNLISLDLGDGFCKLGGLMSTNLKDLDDDFPILHCQWFLPLLVNYLKLLNAQLQNVYLLSYLIFVGNAVNMHCDNPEVELI